MTESKSWPGSRSLQDQLEGAALSVSNNIAEGFERGTTNELLAFIYIARGSAGEVRSMLCQRVPLLSTQRIPLSTWRLSFQGLAPFLPGAIEGSRGSSFFHCSSFRNGVV